mmetsp:Transcript_41863/g.97483  ORF Transcript_41863/g.97483 Transcript_41863/m.97483 type:complete len:229 (+) Transcript_41863:46-732(+)
MEGLFSTPAHPCAPHAPFFDPKVEAGTTRTNQLKQSKQPDDVAAPGCTGVPRMEGHAPPGLLAGNTGSGGHPELCANTCVNFQNGACVKGANCLLCHNVHRDKQVKLDKKQREALRHLTQRELLEVLTRRFTDRGSEAGMASEVFPLVQLMLDKLYSLPLTEPTLSGSGLRNLEKSLGKMSCKGMLLRASTSPNMDALFAHRLEDEILSLRLQLAARAPADSATSVWL